MNETERTNHIKNGLKEHFNYIKDDYDVLYIAVQGSQNYNLDTYTDTYKSDIDTKAIILPSIDNFINNTKPISTTLILPNSEHCDIKDIRVMFDTFKKQNVNFIEILFTEYNIVNPDYVDLFYPIIKNRENIAHLNINQALRCICGMSMEKYNALERMYPNCVDDINNYGYSRKQYHHIARMNDFVKKYIKPNVGYEDCLIPSDINYLMDIKVNPKPLEEVRIKAKEMNEETYKIAHEHITEVDTVNNEAIDILENVKYNILRSKFKKELV